MVLTKEELATLEIISTVPKDSKGFKRLMNGVSLKEGVFTKEELDFFVNYFCGEIGSSYSFKMNKAKNANKMFNIGWGWINGNEFFALKNADNYQQAIKKLLFLSDDTIMYNKVSLREVYKQAFLRLYAHHRIFNYDKAIGYNDPYFYMEYNPINGVNNPKISAEILKILETKLGEKINFNATIGNLYYFNTMIQNHKDTTEPDNGQPICSLVLGNPYSVSFISNKNDSNTPKRTTERYIADIRGITLFGKENPTIPLKQGSMYKIGYKIREKLVGRFTSHMPHPNNLTGLDNGLELPEIHGDSNYALSVTFRDIEPNKFKIVDNQEILNNGVDGVDYINVYSKGKTKLGQMLSNFYASNFTYKGETFASVESFWYWHKMTQMNIGYPHDFGKRFTVEDIENVKTKQGYYAKKLFRDICGKKHKKWNTDRFNPTMEELKEVYIAKLSDDPKILEELMKNKKPLTHYYDWGAKRTLVHKYLWTVELWIIIAKELHIEENKKAIERWREKC